MANTAQARKRARQSVALNMHNSSLRSMFRTAIKRVRTAIETGDKAAAAEVLQKATSVIDRVADKNIIHKIQTYSLNNQNMVRFNQDYTEVASQKVLVVKFETSEVE